MDKTKLFMTITAIISFICIRFDKIINCIISTASQNMYDSSIIPIGIHYKSLPINTVLVMIDGETVTNKFKLMMYWKWDFNANGFRIPDIHLIKPDAQIVIIRAIPKYTNEVKHYRIDLNADTITISDPCSSVSDSHRCKSSSTNDILFGEICMIPNMC